ncbi:MAG: LptA/OstA family protein [Alphaproteobacteria bacterium]
MELNRPAFLFATLVGGVVMATGAQSQTLGFSRMTSAPIEIEADEGIEWHRANQLYVARGNAKASQGVVTVEADSLTAFYRVTSAGDSEIFRIDADGSVRISSAEEVATADKAVYDVDKGILVLTGDEIQLDTKDSTITAEDSLEYYEQTQLAVARGNAVASQPDRRVQADVLMAHFAEQEGAERGSKVDRIEAVGNVVIWTPTDLVQASRGEYRIDEGIATLNGAVRITRGENQLNGEFAEVDLNTGISRLLGGSPTSGKSRVRGLIVPSAKDSLIGNPGG